MENKDKTAFPAFDVDGMPATASKLYENITGLTKLEYAVIHNMPKLTEPNYKRSKSRSGSVLKADVTLNTEDAALIDKTIEACRYALEALSNEE